MVPAVKMHPCRSIEVLFLRILFLLEMALLLVQLVAIVASIIFLDDRLMLSGAISDGSFGPAHGNRNTIQ